MEREKSRGGMDDAPGLFQLADTVKRLIQEIGRHEDRGDYTISHLNVVPFGADGTSIGNHLVLGGVRSVGNVSALRYVCKSEPHVSVKIDLVQKIADADMVEARRVLGTHPHELLMRQFVSRLKPILELVPDAEVALEPPTHNEDLVNMVYKPLRHTFFTRDWKLNPRKKAVREILGEELCRRMRQE